MTAGGGGQSRLGLKAKEKILVQLCLHRCEPDSSVFPFEVTQKGLSEHLDLRRSHVAVALQDLVKDGFVEAVKGHVDGGERRQFAYCVTVKGYDEACSLRDRIHEMEVDFEDASGRTTLKVSEIVSSRKASLASVICQIERGGPVRDEIAVMTAPEKRMISVFCPTCKKQIEVDNIYKDDEVGFDCPGCGRPYRIVSALRREEPPPERTSFTKEERSERTVIAAIATAMVMVISYLVLPECLSSVAIAGAAAGLVVWILAGQRRKRAPKPRTISSSMITALVLSPALLVMWHLTVDRIDVVATLEVLAGMIAVLVAVYAVVRVKAPEQTGDFMLSSGCAIILVAATTTFVVDLGPIDVSMALAIGMVGGALAILSSFYPMDRDALLLDCALGAGVFLLFLFSAFLLWDASDVPDYLAAFSAVVLATVLISLRIAREVTGQRDLSSHMVASAVLAAALCLIVMGMMIADGGDLAAGMVEIAAAAPFAYLGVRGVFDDQWTRKLPLAAVFVAVGVLALVAGFVT